MKNACLAVAFLFVAAVAPAGAQMAPAAGAHPLSGSLKRMFDGVKLNLKESAEKVPEADYAFKPTPEVRSFGQLIGHVANAHFGYCARAKGEKSPSAEDFEKTTGKAALLQALNDSIAYCDGLYGSMTDQAAMEMLPGQNPSPRVSTLIFIVSHDNEHYGNLVTYMRLKGIVPPSTERAQQPRRPSDR